MLNTSNTIKATQLVNRLTTDPVKRGQILSRLIQLTDSAFTLLFDGLNTARFYTAQIYNLGYARLPNGIAAVKIRFSWQDILSGENGQGEKIISNSYFEPTERWTEVLKIFANDLVYLSRIGDKLFFKNPGVGGYTIQGYEPIIINPGYGGTGGTGTTTPPTNTEPVKSEIENMILPIAIALGLYLVLK